MSLSKRFSHLRSKLKPGEEEAKRKPAGGEPESTAERRAKRTALRADRSQPQAPGRPRKPASERKVEPVRKGAAEGKPAARRQAGGTDPLATVVNELIALVREMLAIPAQAYMAVAEAAGAGVLWAWRHAVLPLLALVAALAVALYRLALRHVTPARAVVAVALVAIVALAASQWLDYRGVSVGTDAYSGDVELVAPAPDVDRDRAGDAHAWVMLPLAAVALAALVLALRGRARAALLLVPAGAVAILVSAAVDAPKGLDEGVTAIAYQGVEARLLEGFWLQVAAGSVLVACGLLLPLYLRARPEPAPTARPGSGPSSLRKLAERTGVARQAGGPPKGRMEEASA